MGSALGFALTQPAWAALLVFTMLALGMAAPYLVLSASPRLLRFVPRPGAWMETFKQLMGFFMMGTVVVLLWVFGQQAGVLGLVTLLGALVLLALGAWIYGRGTAPGSSVRQVRVAVVLGALAVAAGLFVGFGRAALAQPEASSGPRVEAGLVWQTWSPEAVAAARAAGQPVLIDFTAAWCLTCQVNERVALAAPDVRARLLSERVTLFRADWTLRDDAITRALASYGRTGVPVYVLYGRGRAEPHLLPEVLSPGLVLSALDSHI
jgi:thiol:disulfide interchange protein DsbD